MVMASEINSFHLASLIAGLLVVAACDRQPAAPPATDASATPAAQATPPAAKSSAASSATAAIAAAVANPARPADDVAHDADRKPTETLAFFEVKPGEVVFEFVAGSGYFTELLSRTVGDTGRVVATREDPKRIADKRLPNVTAAEDREWSLAPDSVDLIFTAQNYHDVVNLKVERPPLLRNFLTILKPGGIFAVIDHSAETDSADRDVGTLHRIDEAMVVSEIKAAGFELVDTSDLLRNPNDARSLAVFDPAIRGKTDQFVLKFRKPAG
jgi:predicted methyltransferase